MKVWHQRPYFSVRLGILIQSVVYGKTVDSCRLSTVFLSKIKKIIEILSDILETATNHVLVGMKYIIQINDHYANYNDR